MEFIRKPNFTNLNLNEFDFKHCDDIQQVLTKPVSLLITKYHNIETSIKLILKIAEYNKVNNKNILLTNGGDRSIEVIIDHVLGFLKTTIRKPKVSIIGPTYGFYKQVCKNRDIKYNIIDTKMIDDMISDDIVFICNPNNPNGKTYNITYIEKLLIKYPSSIFIIDETYMDFLILTNKNISVSSLILKYNNIYIVKSFSKAFGLAGIRIGYIMAHEENIKNINENHKNITEISKLCGIAVLDNIDYYRNKAVIMYNNKKKINRILNTI